MSEELGELAERLCGMLEAETALLESLDLAEAGALLPGKRDAVAALHGALADGAGVAALDAEQSGALRESMQRLTMLADANRLALERGLALQTELIQAIAHAVPRARATNAPNYQPDGSQAPPRPPEAFAFQSRM